MPCSPDDLTPENDSFELLRGDLFAIEFSFEQMVDPDADPKSPDTLWEPMPITGELICQVREQSKDNPEVWTEPVLGVTEAADGVVTVTIPAAVMATAVPGRTYYVDLQIVDGATLASWDFQVEADVSRP